MPSKNNFYSFPTSSTPLATTAAFFPHPALSDPAAFLIGTCLGPAARPLSAIAFLSH